MSVMWNGTDVASPDESSSGCAADAAEGVLLFTPLGEKLGNFGLF